MTIHDLALIIHTEDDLRRKIAEYMLIADESTETLAQKAAIAPLTVRTFLSGKRRIRVKTALRLASYLVKEAEGRQPSGLLSRYARMIRF